MLGVGNVLAQTVSPPDGDVTPTFDSLTVTGDLTFSGDVTSVGGMFLDDDLQVGDGITWFSATTSRIFTGAESALNYSTNPEFGSYDISATDDLFVDDKLFVGSNVTMEAGDLIVGIGDVEVDVGKIVIGSPSNTGDNGDLVVEDDIMADGYIRSEEAIGYFYRNYTTKSLSTGWNDVQIECDWDDVVVACGGRVNSTGANYHGSKYLGDNGFGDACEAYGSKGTAESAKLYVYTYCFSPDGP